MGCPEYLGARFQALEEAPGPPDQPRDLRGQQGDEGTVGVIEVGRAKGELCVAVSVKGLLGRGGAEALA